MFKPTSISLQWLFVSVGQAQKQEERKALIETDKV